MLGVARQKLMGRSLGKILPVASQTFVRTCSGVSKEAVYKGQGREAQDLFRGSKESWTHDSEPNNGGLQIYQIGQNLSRRDKINFLVTTLMDLKDSKEAVYGALDAWVAWEQNFPIAALKNVILSLEKQHQWHKVIQVIKWMLSKGQGNTLGTYRQLIRALDMDHRAEEAHNFWMRKIGADLHSVPWQLCHLMISVYYRNNMLENLMKLFKRLEAFGREPPDKLIVQKVANAYEVLGLTEEKESVMEKYKHLLSKTNKDDKKSRRASSKKTKKSGQEKHSSKSDETVGFMVGGETYESNFSVNNEQTSL